jgi:hypothetical protein
MKRLASYVETLVSVIPLSVFRLAIALSVLLQFTASDYPFGIFKLFSCMAFSLFLLVHSLLPLFGDKTPFCHRHYYDYQKLEKSILPYDSTYE